MSRARKRIAAMVLIQSMLFTGITPCALSEAVSISTEASIEDSLFYTVNDQGVIIEYYDGNFSEFSIPEMMDGAAVVEIGAGAFADRAEAIIIEIPASIETIAEDAFENSPQIELKVYEGSSAAKYAAEHGIQYTVVTDSIVAGEAEEEKTEELSAENQDNAVEEVETEKYTSGDFEYIKLEDGTAEIVSYDGTDASLVIPSKLDGFTVTSIGEYAFFYCDALTEISIPDSVITIGDSAFSICDALKRINIPDSVTSIGDCAFSNCNALTEISIPDSVAFMGSNPFKGCDALKEIKVSPEHPVLVIIDGALIDKTEKKLIYYSCDFDNNSFRILQGIRVIGDSAFSNCDVLTEISIPNSVTTIGASAFYGCDALAEISIPDSVTTIGASAFYGCDALAEISIPDSVTTIGESAFSDCDSLKTISIPNSVTTIGDYAFDWCSSLAEINIPDSVIFMGANPFAGCYALRNIRVSPDNLVLATIDGVLFGKQEKKLICYPCAFDSGSYTIPQGILAIGDDAFQWCSSLTEINIPDSVTTIGDSAFVRCEALTKISIPDSVTSIGDSAFAVCEALTEINIPDSVTSIGDSAFSYCEALMEISIPDSVTSIGGFAFANCEALMEISIPDSVTSIGGFAFANCDALTEISIPDSVTSIGDYAFYGSDALTEISIPDSVTTIGDDAFPTNANFTIVRGSYAAQYLKERGMNYTYTDAYDWLYT